MINIIKQSIASDYHLKNGKGDWLVHGEIGDIRLKVSDDQSASDNSIGFSLDKTTEIPPLAIFAGSPSCDLAKMCDAMIALTDQNKLYLFAIELKSGSPRDHKKQLANGKHFWQWLMALCKEHGYLTSDLIYARVLIIEPRKYSRKGKATRERRIEDGILKIQNTTTVDLAKIRTRFPHKET